MTQNENSFPTTTGKDIATCPFPHIQLNEMTRLQSSCLKSSGLHLTEASARKNKANTKQILNMT